MPTTLSRAVDGLAFSIAALRVYGLLSFVVAFDRMLTVSPVDQVTILEGIRESSCTSVHDR
jgi:hypothetical protein